jgi:hypothetical protein
VKFDEKTGICKLHGPAREKVPIEWEKTARERSTSPRRSITRKIKVESI